MNYYPPVGFFFRVEFRGIAEGKTVDTNFQEVSGLSVDIEVEKFQEGGVNDYQHPLPKPPKFPNLSLKRGLLLDSKLVDWLKKATERFEIQPIDVGITLLNPKAEPLMAWELENAWPIKWDVSGFNAQDNGIVVETIELAYRKFRRTEGSTGLKE